MRVSSPTEARSGFIATALSLPLALLGAGLTLALFGTIV